jgi:hypothetical protein
MDFAYFSAKKANNSRGPEVPVCPPFALFNEKGLSSLPFKKVLDQELGFSYATCPQDGLCRATISLLVSGIYCGSSKTRASLSIQFLTIIRKTPAPFGVVPRERYVAIEAHIAHDKATFSYRKKRQRLESDGHGRTAWGAGEGCIPGPASSGRASDTALSGQERQGKLLENRSRLSEQAGYSFYSFRASLPLFCARLQSSPGRDYSI